MKITKGYNMNFDIKNLIKVSDLIFFDGPLLSHYISHRGENYLFYWVDVDDIANRWLIIRTDIFTIQEYLDKKITLYDVITNPNDGFVYLIDIDDETNFSNCQIVQISQLPDDYIPAEDSFYNFELRDDINLSAISQKYSSGILEIHISGRDVKYGSIPLHKFAPIIPKIEDIRKSMSSKYIKNKKQKKDKNTKQNIDRKLRLDTHYEYLYSLAGSIRIILKPINNQISINDASFGETFADDFAREFTGLFVSGYSKDEILKYSNNYDKQVIKKYDNFISYLNEENLSVGLKWYNATSQASINENIDIADMGKILTNLSDFEYDNTEEISIEGKFYSLNVRTGSYSFESSEGDDFKSSGYFNSTCKQNAYSVSFNKKYKVIIERKTTEKVGRKEDKKDTIVSLIEIN